MMMDPRIALLSAILVATVPWPALGKQCDMSEVLRFDCDPERASSQQVCESRGCCWKVDKRKEKSNRPNSIGVPYCFYPTDYEFYHTKGPIDTEYGCTANLTRSSSSYYPGTIKNLRLDIYYETKSRLHFKIYDPTQQRYEVPISTPKVTKKASETDYDVLFPSYGMGFGVTRKSTDTPIFNTSVNNGGFLYNDQFIQISTILTSNYVYGLGEHRSSLLRSTNWSSFSFWNRDFPPTVNSNLYGTHPFYLVMEPTHGNAYGVFLLNSNAMEVILQPTPAVTFRTIGGILDFYIFLGPTPEEVIQQYMEVIGRPFLPPYWGLGFHLCRWGYNSANRTLEIVNRMRQAGIPQDTQWNDIDYMEAHKDFTTDPKSYSTLPDVVADIHGHKQHYISMIDVQWNDIEYAIHRKDFTLSTTSFSNLPAVIDNLHESHQHYIPIVDPAISSKQPSGSYPPYDDGVKQDVFIKDANGKILIGQVWPGPTAFPDWFKPETSDWWKTQMQGFHKTVPYDGVWLDMNEPSNFVDGSTTGCIANSTLDYPPYLPYVTGGKLYAGTVCPSAQQSLSSHYNLHSLFGISEVMVTNKILKQIRGKRPFIISRSTFPSSGVYGGHWLGDNYATWDDMHYSITGILNFNMYGIPMVGADICGFQDNTYEELCVRWHQLGAFYPFSRNHNSLVCSGRKLCIDQDPTAWSTPSQAIIRDALMTRYSLLPYLYSLFVGAHVNGSTVARPLFFEFPQDPSTYAVDRQFMWGSHLLITPVLEGKATSVEGTFPAGTWYDFYNGSSISVTETTNLTLDAPIEKINLHMREGSILPMQEPNTTTYVSRGNAFELRAAVSPKTGTAKGALFWDDGDTIGTYESGDYIHLHFSLTSSQLVSTVVHSQYKGTGDMVLAKISIYGLEDSPSTVTVNGDPADYLYNQDIQTLKISGFAAPMNSKIIAEWSV